MAILGTQMHEKREGFNVDALRRKQLDKLYRKLQHLIEFRRPGDATYTPEMILERLKQSSLNETDYQAMKQYRPVVYNYIASLVEKKEEAPVSEEAEVVEAPAPAEPKRRGKSKITANLEE